MHPVGFDDHDRTVGGLLGEWSEAQCRVAGTGEAEPRLSLCRHVELYEILAFLSSTLSKRGNEAQWREVARGHIDRRVAKAPFAQQHHQLDERQGIKAQDGEVFVERPHVDTEDLGGTRKDERFEVVTLCARRFRSDGRLE